MEIVFWLVVLIAFIAVMFLAKLSHLKHRLSIIFLILLCLFLYISFIGVASNNSLEIKSVSEFFLATKLYFSWLGHLFGNLQVITGNAVRMDWMPTNSTR